MALVRLDGLAKQSLETGRTRLLVAGVVFALAFLVIAARLVDLTLLTESNEPRIARTPSASEIAALRADIVDRNGVVLATTLPVASLYANPRLVRDPVAAAARITAMLPDLDQSELIGKLSSDRSFAWVKRNISPREQHAINGLGIVGLDFQREEERFHPHGALTSHLVGLTDIDDRGISGVEKSFDALLHGAEAPLALSIDIRLQHILAEELQSSMNHFEAIGAAGIILDAKSGEVLAMVSLPSFDPAAAANSSEEARFNRATLGIYEMGSVFKIFTTAMSLDQDLVRLDDRFDVSKPIKVSRFTITDYHPEKGMLSVPDIFVKSSNIGTVQMALLAGTDRQRAFLDRLGLLRSVNVELPEVGDPLIPSPWRDINTMTISYGHGLAVSPLQVARAVTAVVNGGELLPVTLLKREQGERPLSERAIDAETSADMRWLMRRVVLEGTGRKADAPGYQVGGKTGTADKLKGRGYAHDKRIASFVGAFPMSEPRYVLLTMIDEPKGQESSFGFATGGWVAAPVVSRVVGRIAPLLGLQPVGSEQENGLDQLLIPASARGQVFAAQ